MSVRFSLESRSWEWSCLFGHRDFDFEGEQEAREAFLRHACEPLS